MECAFLMKKRQKKNWCVNCGCEFEQNMRGRLRKFCSIKWTYTYNNRKNAGREKFPGGIAWCEHCGKEFIRAEKSTRKNCSRLCELNRSRREDAEQILEMAKKHMEDEKRPPFRNFVMELYLAGYSRTAITETMGLSPSTIKHWVERYEQYDTGNWHIKNKGGRKYTHVYSTAETALDWLEMNREAMLHKSL